MVHFTLFGIPVYIRPSFWVVLAIFGGALSISSVEDLIYPALFVIAGFVAILSHEMGHALVGRKLAAASRRLFWNSSRPDKQPWHATDARRAGPHDSGRPHDDPAAGHYQPGAHLEHRRSSHDFLQPELLGPGHQPLHSSAHLPQAVHSLLPHHDWRMVDYPESAAHLPPGRRPADRTVHPLPQESIHDRIHHGHPHRTAQFPALPRLLYPHLHGPLRLQQLPGIQNAPF